MHWIDAVAGCAVAFGNHCVDLFSLLSFSVYERLIRDYEYEDHP